MKAIIFNSGIGKRMLELTKNNHKSMVKLKNGETLFERQIRLLSECGIKEFVVTTGYYEQCFKDITDKYKDIKVNYVNNPLYDKTNYIYSFYLAKDYLDDDFIMLHGDLVFNKNLIKRIISSEYSSCVTADKTKELPEKDFKGRFIDDKLKEVSIHIFDDNCYALQPLYKLSKKDINLWMDNVVEFIEKRNIDGVYAENAMNEISDNLDIKFFDASEDFVEEIDNPEDYEKVCKGIQYYDYFEQEKYHNISELDGILKKNNLKKPLIVLPDFLLNSFVFDYIKCDYVAFTKFKANPIYEDVLEAIKVFKDNKCDSIISIGGGSAIDTAKAIKMFLPLDDSKLYLGQEHVYINLKHIAIPTTAGTGSESTRYAVIYYNGIKQSLTNDSIIPDYIILDGVFLKTLPKNQKVATVFDALCQAIESLWSVNSSEISNVYAKMAISIILVDMDEYINDSKYCDEILLAANLAGQAINITQTTAAHALSYKITSEFNIPHGKAVGMCMLPVWTKLVKNVENNHHSLGKDYLEEVFNFLCNIFEVETYEEMLLKFKELSIKYNVFENVKCDQNTFERIYKSVNIERLKNFPLMLNENDIIDIYKEFIIVE